MTIAFVPNPVGVNSNNPKCGTQNFCYTYQMRVSETNGTAFTVTSWRVRQYSIQNGSGTCNGSANESVDFRSFPGTFGTSVVPANGSLTATLTSYFAPTSVSGTCGGYGDVLLTGTDSFGRVLGFAASISFNGYFEF